MLIIKSEQLRAFETIELTSFKKKMSGHIAYYFPKQTAILGQTGLDAVILKGYESAKKYELITSYEVCIYIDLSIMLGHGFDTDRLLFWANDILTDRKIINPTERIDRLYVKALNYMEYTLGKEQSFPVTQFRQIIDFPIQELGVNTKGAEKNIAGYLKKIWIERYESAGEELDSFIRKITYNANRYGFTSDFSVRYFIILAFLLGHNFDTDPQYPWLISVLNNQELENEDYKIECLHAMAKNHFELLLQVDENNEI